MNKLKVCELIGIQN